MQTFYNASLQAAFVAANYSNIGQPANQFQGTDYP